MAEELIQKPRIESGLSYFSLSFVWSLLNLHFAVEA